MDVTSYLRWVANWDLILVIRPFRKVILLRNVLFNWVVLEGLFENWSALHPKKFYAIPFQKFGTFDFLISWIFRKTIINKKLIFGQFSLFLFGLKFLFITPLILLINMSISFFRWIVYLIKTQKFFPTKTTKLCSIILVSKIIEVYHYTENEQWNT